MELKNYQKVVMRDLTAYLTQLNSIIPQKNSISNSQLVQFSPIQFVQCDKFCCGRLLIPQTKKRTALTLSASSFYSCRISASGISSSSGFSGGTMSRISNQNVEPSPSLLLTP